MTPRKAAQTAVDERTVTGEGGDIRPGGEPGVPACRDVDPGIFQADEPNYYPTYALSLCAQCPVKNECLEMFMRFEGGQSGKSRTGIAGGMTPEQRAALARKSGGWGSPRTQTLAYTLWMDGLSDRAIADTAGIKIESVRKFRSSRGLLANPPSGTNQPADEQNESVG